jgi:hypothetical protein
METLSELVFGTARSASVSPLKSATITAAGPTPAAKLSGGEKPPLPFPSSTETSFEPEFATARSKWLSPSKSPTATVRGKEPTAKAAAGPNPPVPSPSSTETVFAPLFTTARSCSPSSFRSAIATERGLRPTPNVGATRNVCASSGPASRDKPMVSAPHPGACMSAWRIETSRPPEPAPSGLRVASYSPRREMARQDVKRDSHEGTT